MRARRPVIAVVAALVVALAAIWSGAAGRGGARPTADVVVHDGGPGTPFDRRLLGTNLPAWVGPAQLADPAFVAATIASGATVIRMPGGSWSDGYDWLACENGAPGCIADDAARPLDYVGFLDATGAAGMWTMNVNATAQAAAALVAYFNGAVDDERPIGVDRDGVDWQTVGTWARLRAEHGHPEPAEVRLWEIGNEVWGAKSTAVGGCAAFGWEDAWTCDGTLYVDGDAAHDGFLATRAAMRAVDPAIAVGAVGIIGQAGWGNWGNEVLDGTAGQLDFYVVHHYGFDRRPTPIEVLGAPLDSWAADAEEVLGAVDAANPGAGVPVAVTEYNLVSFQDLDDEALMTRGVNALYIADTIGQMAEHGIAMGNQWNLINGRAQNGTDYGMLDAGSRAAPQYAGLALWQYAGDTVVPVDGGDEALGAYATTVAGDVVVVAINRSVVPRRVRLAADSIPAGAAVDVAVTSMRAPTLMSTELVADAPSVQGATEGGGAALPSPAVNVPAPMTDVGVVAAPLQLELAPYSITVIRLAARVTDAPRCYGHR